MLKCFQAIGEQATEGVIPGVSVITSGVEAVGHGVRVDAATLASVKACADEFSGGVKVKMNHSSGVDSIVGVLKNFRVEDANLRADLHLLKSHPAFSQIVELSASMPGSFGLSISFSGSQEKIGADMFARCKELYSVDLVDSPAANPGGLFSAAVDSQTLTKTMINEIQELWKSLGEKITALTGKPEATELSAVKSELTNLGAKITTELSAAIAAKTELESKVTTLTASLEKAQGEANTFGAKVKALNEKLDGAVTTLKLECKADANEEEKFASVLGAVNAAIEKTGVDLNKLPGAPAGQATGGKAKTLTRAEFNTLNPQKQSEFCRTGGQITDK